MISGIWLSAWSLGNFVGPTIAGELVDKFGFEWTCLAFGVLFCVVIIKDIMEGVVDVLQPSNGNKIDPA